MARATTSKTAGKTRAKGRVAAASRTRTPASAAKASDKPQAAAPAPKISKDELRAQLQKLEQTVATLRAKNRELTRAAKGGAASANKPPAKYGAHAPAHKAGWAGGAHRPPRYRRHRPAP